jgi:hypothetical protein
MLRMLAVGALASALVLVSAARARAGEIADEAARVFRDYVIDGDPSSPRHWPAKSEIRALFALVDTVFTRQSFVLFGVRLNETTITLNGHSILLSEG